MLKPVHEIATVKDGNKIDGFFISDVRYLTDAKSFKYKHCWYVPMKEMVELVKNNQVQYMVWNSKLGRIEINYTYEETQQLYNTGCYTRNSLDDFLKRTSTLSDYIRNDMILSRQHVELMYAGKALAGYFVTVMKMPLSIDMVSIAVFGANEAVERVIKNYIDKLQDTRYKNIIKVDMEGNTGTVTLPLLCYNGFAQSVNLLVNCSMLYRDKQKGLPSLLMKQGEKAKDACRMVEMNNNLIMERLL